MDCSWELFFLMVFIVRVSGWSWGMTAADLSCIHDAALVKICLWVGGLMRVDGCVWADACGLMRVG